VCTIEAGGSRQVRPRQPEILAKVVDLAADPPPKLALTPSELARSDYRYGCGTLRHAPQYTRQRFTAAYLGSGRRRRVRVTASSRGRVRVTASSRPRREGVPRDGIVAVHSSRGRAA